MIPLPKWEHMSKKLYVTFPTWEEKGGGLNDGRPGVTEPAVINIELPLW